VDADETSADHWIRTAEGAVILARRKRRRELVKLAEAKPLSMTKAKRKTMLEGFAKLLEGETMTGLREIARKPARKAARGRLTKRERSELVAEVAAIVREEVRRALRKEGGAK
jgi:hypothetical protein